MVRYAGTRINTGVWTCSYLLHRLMTPIPARSDGIRKCGVITPLASANKGLSDCWKIANPVGSYGVCKAPPCRTSQSATLYKSECLSVRIAKYQDGSRVLTTSAICPPIPRLGDSSLLSGALPVPHTAAQRRGGDGRLEFPQGHRSAHTKKRTPQKSRGSSAIRPR